MKIETKEELKYVMEFYNIPFVKIIDGGHNMGKVTSDMRYEPGIWKYNRNFVFLAFRKAFELVTKDYNEILTWKEDSKRIFSTRLLCGKWEKEKTLVTDYCWTSDIEKCHIKVSKDEEGNLLLFGRINDLENFRSYANDHMRYLQDRFYFEDDNVKNTIELFERYGLKNQDDDGYEWWRIGIVD